MCIVPCTWQLIFSTVVYKINDTCSSSNHHPVREREGEKELPSSTNLNHFEQYISPEIIQFLLYVYSDQSTIYWLRKQSNRQILQIHSKKIISHFFLSVRRNMLLLLHILRGYAQQKMDILCALGMMKPSCTLFPFKSNKRDEIFYFKFYIMGREKKKVYKCWKCEHKFLWRI